MIEEEIELINDIIVEAICHGADSGGSYDSNEEDLILSIQKWLDFKGIKDYTIKEVKCGALRALQIVKIS